MDEFEFLDAQFRRLTEARGLRHHHEQTREQKPGKRGAVHSEFETAELMVAGAIRDYLKMRSNAVVQTRAAFRPSRSTDGLETP